MVVETVSLQVFVTTIIWLWFSTVGVVGIVSCVALLICLSLILSVTLLMSKVIRISLLLVEDMLYVLL